MSWIERINTDFKITTGDTAQYFPKWLNANKSVEYNTAEFNFKGVSGSLVSRRLPKGRRYNIEIIFDGADCFDTSDAFDKSAANSKAWTISHPVYGQIVVQPLGLSFDNSVYNITKITGQIVETIGTQALNTGVSAPDIVIASATASKQLFAETFAAEVPTPLVATTQVLRTNNDGLFNSIKDLVSDATDFTALTNIYNQANNALNSDINDVVSTISLVQDVAFAPVYFVGKVAKRLAFLQLQFESILASLGITPQKKAAYENNAAACVQAMCAASMTNTDYITRNDVLDAVGVILGTYNQYVTNLDALQTDTGGEITSYVPNANAMFTLSDLVNYTVASLFDVAASAKQQRTMYVKEDTNLILLAYSLYGLIPDDSTIDALKADNSIGLNELLEIKKDRKIIYYV